MRKTEIKIPAGTKVLRHDGKVITLCADVYTEATQKEDSHWSYRLSNYSRRDTIYQVGNVFVQAL